MFKFEDRTEGKVVKNKFITIGRQIEKNKIRGVYFLFKNPLKYRGAYVNPETFTISQELLQDQYMCLFRKNSLDKFKLGFWKVPIPCEE